MKAEVLIPLLFIASILWTIEVRYSPRLGYTRERDIILWYTQGYERLYIHLFKI